MLKVLRAIKEVDQGKPGRGIAVSIKVDYLEKEELEELLKVIMPEGGVVTTIPAPGWVESSYRPV